MTEGEKVDKKAVRDAKKAEIRARHEDRKAAIRAKAAERRGRIEDAQATRTARMHEAAEKAMLEKFRGLTFTDAEVRYGDQGGPIAGAHATVEAAGDIDRRISATRLLLTGPLALAWRKRNDHRELYLVVEGSGFGFVVPVDPDAGLAARTIATRINALAGPPLHDATGRPSPGPLPAQTPPGQSEEGDT